MENAWNSVITNARSASLPFWMPVSGSARVQSSGVEAHDLVDVVVVPGSDVLFQVILHMIDFNEFLFLGTQNRLTLVLETLDAERLPRRLRRERPLKIKER